LHPGISRLFISAAYAAEAADKQLGPITIERRDPTPNDVQIDILFCGVCHSDLHMARNEWGGTVYPVVSGHEILGRAKGRQHANLSSPDKHTGRLTWLFQQRNS
jgi:D-arabinose 1-dehydrogenase-like Zn-dependent alcohol dehydrogenase